VTGGTLIIEEEGISSPNSSEGFKFDDSALEKKLVSEADQMGDGQDGIGEISGIIAHKDNEEFSKV